MATTRSPRRGSMQFWHRVRAKRIYPRIRTWATAKDTGFLGFAGYKAGMTHLMVRENNPNSLSKGEEVFTPVTIIECPPLKISSIHFYKNSPKGLKVAAEVPFKADKELGRRLVLPKKLNDSKLAEVEKRISEFVDVRVMAYTQPKLTGIGQKRPALFELGISGKTVADKLAFIKQFIGKDISIKDVFRPGQQLDIKGVSTGKGFQGTTKRFGSAVRGRKTEKAKRGIGTLGPWHPHHVLYTVPQPGKMGFHTRTEYNKWLLAINDKPAEINPKGGLGGYGVVKNEYVLIKGGIIGPVKRMIRMNLAIRPSKKIVKEAPEITYISLESKTAN
jgi:large subunit ribosomal protein L3